VKKFGVAGIAIISILIILGIFVATSNKIKESKEFESFHILGPGDYEFFLNHNGLERRYLVHVPFSYEKEVPTPLVFSIHGGGGTVNGFKRSIDFDSNAEKNNYILVYLM